MQPDAKCSSGPVPSKEFCAGAADGSVAATNMDSGGPLVVQQNGRWALAGVPPEIPQPSLAGVVQFNGRMGSVVRMPDARPKDPALLLTNGHCVPGNRPAVSSALADQPANFPIGIADHDGYDQTMRP